jgi:four helix bundle protein
MRAFRNLLVWERAHALTLEIYEATAGFPNEERFGLTSQLRRGASSIPTNLAEGCGRNSRADMARFVDYASGSASEVEYLLLLSCELGYLDEPRRARLAGEVTTIRKMLAGLSRRLRDA